MQVVPDVRRITVDEIKEAAKEMSKMTAIMAVIPISCFIFGGFLAEF